MSILTPGRRWQPAYAPFKKEPFGRQLLANTEYVIKSPLFGCRMCGNCLLQETAFLCPMECPKGLRNGPCGGSTSEYCYVDKTRPCIWYKIYERSFRMNRQEKLLEVLPPLDWEKTGTETWGDVSGQVLKLGTAKVKAKLEKIVRIVDAGQDLAARTLETEEPTRINRHEVAECILALSKALAFDLAGECADTGRFVLVDDFDICGGGIVLEDAGDAQQWVRDSVMLRNLKWEKSEIPAEVRAERYNQRATLILVTGQKGIGRKQVAKRLETLLFENGKIVYYLAIGSVLYGVDADLKEKGAAAARQEHMRRLAEVAHILLDAGVILIVTAIELTQADLEIIKTAADGTQIETIWIGENVTTDIAIDIQLPGGDQAEHSASQIKQLLQDCGVIYRP